MGLNQRSVWQRTERRLCGTLSCASRLTSQSNRGAPLCGVTALSPQRGGTLILLVSVIKRDGEVVSDFTCVCYQVEWEKLIDQEPRVKSQEPRVKSQEPRANDQEPRTKSQEPRANSFITILKSQSTNWTKSQEVLNVEAP